MSVLIDDLAWVSICLAVVTVFFVISVAFIFLDEGLRILFRKARQWMAGPSGATQTTAVPLPAGRKPLKKPARTTGRGKGAYEGPFRQILATAWHKLQSKLRTSAGETHRPFRWGHH